MPIGKAAGDFCCLMTHPIALPPSPCKRQRSCFLLLGAGKDASKGCSGPGIWKSSFAWSLLLPSTSQQCTVLPMGCLMTGCRGEEPSALPTPGPVLPSPCRTFPPHCPAHCPPIPPSCHRLPTAQRIPVALSHYRFHFLLIAPAINHSDNNEALYVDC